MDNNDDDAVLDAFLASNPAAKRAYTKRIAEAALAEEKKAWCAYGLHLAHERVLLCAVYHTCRAQYLNTCVLK